MSGKSGPFTKREIRDMVQEARLISAKEGDTAAARELLSELAKHIKGGAPLTDPVRLFLADALERIAGGEDANSALLVKRGKGRPKNTERDYLIARAVRYLNKHCGYLVKTSAEGLDACAYVASQLEKRGERIDPGTVANIYSCWRQTLETTTLTVNGQDADEHLDVESDAALIDLLGMAHEK